VTGGYALSFQGLHHRKHDKLANTREVLFHCVVGDTQNRESPLFEPVRPDLIGQKSFFFIVLGSVEFNHQPGRMTVEIYNISVDHLLAQETGRIPAQKVIPKVSLFSCHMIAEGLRQTCQRWIVLWSKFR
jgi:hypothetical protein